ncbi:MAG: TSUP family transporter [Leptonema sp. (in: bacteria)]
MDYIILGTLIFLGFFLQTLTGFGSNVIILSLGILFFDFYEILPIALLFNIVMGIYFLFNKFTHFEFPFIFKKILFVMGIGFFIGTFISNYLKSINLNINKILSLIVLFFSLYDLFLFFFKGYQLKTNPIMSNFWIFISGLVQAIFATGGPFLVYALQNLKLTKESFRNSLIFIWLIFNFVLILQNPIHWEQLKTSAIISLSLPLSIYLGEKVHSYISVEKFHILTRIVLIISSILVLIK